LSVSEIVERRAELLLEEAPGQSRAFRLAEGQSYLGSGDDALIRVEDEVLSARHLELDWDGTELWLVYLNRGPRPLVNGKLVSEAQLRSGDHIEIVGRSLRVRILKRSRPATAAELAAGLATADTAPSRAGGSRGQGDAATAPAPAAAQPAPAEPAPPVVRPDEQVLLEYSVHLLREQPRRGALVVAGLLAFPVVTYFWLVPGSATAAFIGTAVLVGSVGAYLFPLKYRLTEAGVEIRGFPVRDNKRWRRFASHVEFSDAVQLLVSQRDLRGRIIKGSLLYFGSHKDRIMEIVRAKVPKGGPPAPETKGKRKKQGEPEKAPQP
jgi:hypothetical protein